MFEIQNETENILISEKYINTQVEVYQSKSSIYEYMVLVKWRYNNSLISPTLILGKYHIIVFV